MLDRAKRSLRELLRRTAEVRADAPALVRDRSLLKRWLLSARRAQIALAALVLAGLFVVPPATDAVGDAIFDPVTSRGGFLGLRSSRHRNPKAETTATVLTVLYWLGSATAVGWMLWLHIPEAVRGRREEGEGGRDPSDVSHEPTMLAEEGSSGDRSPAATAATALGGASGHAESSASVSPSVSAGRYEVQQQLGRGAMGIVHRATDSVLGRQVALKELSPDLVRNESLATRFRQEARVLAQLSHANIVQVYDLVEDGERMWIAMELVEGGSLADLLEERGPLPAREAAELGAQMARALAYAHRRDVVHRDFKPDNVMMTEDGHPKVMDFGLAKLLRQAPELTQEGSILGSPAYMSPEQAAGRPADGRADVYAFGATLYQMATGRPPFEGDTVEVLTQHLTQPPKPLRELVSDLPEALEALVLELLEKEPGDRPSDLKAVAERLEALR